MSFSIHNCEIPKQWDNWFITVKNRHNGCTLHIETIKHEELESIDINREHWKLYISMHLLKGEVFQTSSIEHFNEETMEVTTKNGSNYILNTPLNNNMNLITYVKEYFEIN